MNLCSPCSLLVDEKEKISPYMTITCILKKNTLNTFDLIFTTPKLTTYKIITLRIKNNNKRVDYFTCDPSTVPLSTTSYKISNIQIQLDKLESIDNLNYEINIIEDSNVVGILKFTPKIDLNNDVVYK